MGDAGACRCGNVWEGEGQREGVGNKKTNANTNPNTCTNTIGQPKLMQRQRPRPQRQLQPRRWRELRPQLRLRLSSTALGSVRHDLAKLFRIGAAQLG